MGRQLGDDERTRELEEFLFKPARKLGLRGSVHGVRFPKQAIARIERAGLKYKGWVANHRAPELFARHRLTVHIPRRPYVEALPASPRSARSRRWRAGSRFCARREDAEGLFRPGQDYLVAEDGKAMRTVLSDEALAARLVENGLQTIRARHTCAHRGDELMAVLAELSDEAVAAR